MSKILINEFYRGGVLTGTGTGDEFIELLLVEDLTAAQLNTFFVGDSTAAKASKFAAYDFTNMDAIAPIFRAGTIIAVGGTVRFAQDTSYNPSSGDWNIFLTPGGAFLPNANVGNDGNLAADDIAWVDTTNTGATISADGFAVDIGTATGPFTAAINVNFGTSTNNRGYRLNTDLVGATTTANWTTGVASGSTTPGLPNGGANTTYIDSLRNIPTTPTVNLSVSSNVGSEANSTVIIVTAIASSPVLGNQTVTVEVTGAGITAGDYSFPSGNVITIPSGQTTGAIAFVVTNDVLFENDEIATLTLSHPSAGLTLGSSISQSLTISSDDLLLPDLDPAIITPGPLTVGVPFHYTLDVQNNGSAAANGVTLTFTLPANVTYNTFTISGGGFNAPTLSGSTLTFTGGNLAAGSFAQISVNVTPTQAGTLGGTTLVVDPGNTISESNELNNAISTQTFTVNPAPGVTIAPSGGSTVVAEGGAIDTYTIVLNSAPTANVTITPVADAQTAVSFAGPVIFTPGNWSTPQTVTVTAIDDTAIEGTHSSTIAHLASSSDSRYNGMAIAAMTAIVTDNDGSSPVSPRPDPDFNGDGNADILWANVFTGDVATWTMNGTTVGGYANLAVIAPASGWMVVAAADFSRDGKTDLLLRNYATGDVGLWTMNGTIPTGFVSLGIVGLTSGWDVVGVGDLNGNGHQDILWRNFMTGDMGYWSMSGTTAIAYQALPALAPDSGWEVGGVGDLTNDGMADLLLRNYTTGANGLWQMGTAGVVGYTEILAVAPGNGWEVASVSDFTKDGNADLLWWNSFSGQSLFWSMQGTAVRGSLELQPAIAPSSGWYIVG
ncbi:MAG: FG-GAP-like repeat-containing protein [Leptolyngbyaceae cyanobacterium bins.349]|nr:FG-GAP-like repeat-containing protein [Leptolyngbyaceae cyanobacterium bins.349]